LSKTRRTQVEPAGHQSPLEDAENTQDVSRDPADNFEDQAELILASGRKKPLWARSKTNKASAHALLAELRFFHLDAVWRDLPGLAHGKVLKQS
jgi:hypothetical protein